MPKYNSPVQAEAFRSRMIESTFSQLGPARMFSTQRLAKTLDITLKGRNVKKLRNLFETKNAKHFLSVFLNNIYCLQ